MARNNLNGNKRSNVTTSKKVMRALYTQSRTLSKAIMKSAAAIEKLPRYKFSGIRTLDEMTSRKGLNT